MTYGIDKKVSYRITILKGILIILVVYIHSYREEIVYIGKKVMLITPRWLEYLKYLISHVIGKTAVPMFFLLASILLYRKEFTWKENMCKKVKTILVPYLILNSLWIMVFYLAQKVDALNPYFVTSQSQVAQWGVRGWLDAYFGNVLDAYPLLYPTWFLRDLFLLNVFAIGIKKCVDRMPKIILFVILCLWLTPLPVPFIGEHGVSDQSLVFFVMGYYIVKYQVDLRAIDGAALWKMALVYAAFVLTTVLSLCQPVYYMVRHMTVLVGIVFFYKFSQWLEESRFKNICVRFARHSFFVFAFHEMSLTIVMKLLADKIPQTWQVQLTEYFLLPCLVISACLALSLLMRTFFPRAYSVLSGGRG